MRAAPSRDGWHAEAGPGPRPLDRTSNLKIDHRRAYVRMGNDSPLGGEHSLRAPSVHIPWPSGSPSAANGAKHSFCRSGKRSGVKRTTFLPGWRSKAWTVVAAACLATSSASREARADEVPDTVMLTNGGRVRGTVMEEDPAKGTSIRLLDGNVKRFSPQEVKEVIYGGGPAPAAPVATPSQGAPPLPAPNSGPVSAPPPASTSSFTGTPPSAPPTKPLMDRTRLPSGIEIGFRTGYAIPSGSIDGDSGDPLGNPLSNYTSGVIPFWFDAGYRLAWPSIFVGGYFQYGVGLGAGNDGQSPSACSAAGLSCSAHVIMVGLQAQWHILPSGTLDPWVGLGIGMEFASASESGSSIPSGASGSTTISASGWDYQIIQGGLDIHLVRDFSFGPFIMFAVGEYSTESQSSSHGGSQSVTINSNALHEWVTLGVRALYDIHL
jgi:hypothetical protein